MLNPIKWLLTKSAPNTKETIVSDLTAADSAPARETTSTVTTGVAYSEAEIAKLKAILKALGHDIESVWDEALSLVKKSK